MTFTDQLEGQIHRSRNGVRIKSKNGLRVVSTDAPASRQKYTVESDEE